MKIYLSLIVLALLFLCPEPEKFFTGIMPRSAAPIVPVSMNTQRQGTGAHVALYRNLAHEAYLYLNAFRSKPSYFGSKIGLDLGNVKSTRALVWDPILAAAAEDKAADMAQNNFFGHIDPAGYGMNYRVQQKGYLLPPEWTAKQSANFIESIAANSKDPAHFIDQLIIDKGIPGKGHRLHLLAISNFYNNASRIGIAIAYNRNSTYKYYCCILIAPRFSTVAADQ